MKKEGDPDFQPDFEAYLKTDRHVIAKVRKLYYGREETIIEGSKSGTIPDM